ncbi:MAG TPA: DUF4430 domain-containing protein [Gaiellaceae bacterium]|nr:DUF4430 domain-containing protein [Gaiellaceae bacterium]
MLRRSITLPATIVLVLALAGSASAALVRVRVEGKSQTIFGATQPRASATTALGALESASIGGEFYYHVQVTNFGPYVDQIGRHPAGGSSGWVFKVNGASPPVGADQVELKDGDVVLWYWGVFGEAGGPATLELARERSGCYRVTARNDAGAAVFVSATLRVDSRRVPMRSGRACPGPHRSLVRATAPGAVRSNALP